ncbi:MAG TPA: hypothetical protein VG899_12350 [Mycobacteriales bacterium]|nr:hypothetical protein [Mycobacteriales bacterium]
MVDPSDTEWEFTSVSHPRARKEHRCDECRRIIKSGEVYQRFAGKCDGYLSSYTTCSHCEAAVGWLIKACEGYIFGLALADLREHWDDSPDYRSPTLKLLIDGMASGWHDGLDEVPSAELVAAAVPVAAA